MEISDTGTLHQLESEMRCVEKALDDALEAIRALASLTEKLSDRIRALESRGKY